MKRVEVDFGRFVNCIQSNVGRDIELDIPDEAVKAAADAILWMLPWPLKAMVASIVERMAERLLGLVFYCLDEAIITPEEVEKDASGGRQGRVQDNQGRV